MLADDAESSCVAFGRLGRNRRSILHEDAGVDQVCVDDAAVNLDNEVVESIGREEDFARSGGGGAGKGLKTVGFTVMRV